MKLLQVNKCSNVSQIKIEKTVMNKLTNSKYSTQTGKAKVNKIKII